MISGDESNYVHPETFSGSAFFFQILKAVAQGRYAAFGDKVHERRQGCVAKFRSATERNLVLAEQLDCD